MADDTAKGTIDERLEAATAQPSNQPATEQPKEEAPQREEQPESTPDSNSERATPEPDEEKEALDNSKNPDRTRAYIEKLKAEKAEALAKLRDKETPQEPQNFGTSVFDAFHPERAVEQTRQQTPAQVYQPPQGLQYLNPGQVNAIQNSFVDAEGNVDVEGLNKALSEANRIAHQATERARQAEERITRFEETQQVRELHSTYPELDPMNKGKFDPKFFEFVRDRMVRNWAEGKNMSAVEVARDIRSAYAPTVTQDVTKAKAQAVEEYKQTQEARRQGPIETGRGEPRQTTGNLQELRARTRKGDDNALHERLKALGITS